MREEEMSEVHYVLKYGEKVLHQGSVKIHPMLPIDIGRHPDAPLSITKMVEAAAEKGLDQKTRDEVMERLRMISRQHLSLLKHAGDTRYKGYLLTYYSPNASHALLRLHAKSGEVEAPLRQHDQIPGIDATQPLEIHFPKPFQGAKKLLVLRFKIEEPTH